MAKAGQQLLPRATFKIGASYAHTEQRVTREQHLFGFTIERDPTRGVSRRMEHTQLMTSKSDDIAIGKEAADRWCGVIVGYVKEIGRLFGHISSQEFVFSMQFRLESECLVNSIISEAVIQMAVGAKQVHRLQVPVVQVSHDGLALTIEEGTTVDDDTLLGLITDNIGILLKQIELKSLNVQHCFSEKREI